MIIKHGTDLRNTRGFLDCAFRVLIGWAGKLQSHGRNYNGETDTFCCSRFLKKCLKYWICHSVFSQQICWKFASPCFLSHAYFFFRLVFVFLRFSFCVQRSDHNHVIFTNHSFVSVPSGQLQNNWRKENKLKPRVSTRCPFISVISWDLLSFLLTAAHYRYACSVGSVSGAHALYCLSGTHAL